MTEKHDPTKKLDQEVIAKTLGPTEKVFNGAVIGGVFMAPRIDIDPEILAEKERNISQHKS